MNEEYKDIENTEQPSSQDTSKEEVPSTMQNNIPEKSTSGPIIGITIIVILLIIGGVYFWYTAIEQNKEENKLPTIQSGAETDAIVNKLESQGTSDKITDIETDLNKTDLKNLDSGFSDTLK